MQLSGIAVSVKLHDGDMILASGFHPLDLYLPEISHSYRVRSEASHYARPFYTWAAEDDEFPNRVGVSHSASLVEGISFR